MSLVERWTHTAGCLPRLPFRELVPAAARAGYGAITLWPNIWRHAQKKDGLTLASMRRMLEDHRIVLTDIEYSGDWVPAKPGVAAPKAAVGRTELFETAVALGGSTITAAHTTGEPLVLERDTEGFARLCDDAAKYGLRIALEPIGFSIGVPDIATGWRIVEGSGRVNAGLVADVAHHRRSSNDDEALRRVPAARIFTVQLVDGPAAAPADLENEARYGRLLPGTGEFDVVGWLRVLAGMGVRANVGPEIYATSYETRPPVEVMRELLGASKRVVEAATAGGG